MREGSYALLCRGLTKLLLIVQSGAASPQAPSRLFACHACPFFCSGETPVQPGGWRLYQRGTSQYASGLVFLYPFFEIRNDQYVNDKTADTWLDLDIKLTGSLSSNRVSFDLWQDSAHPQNCPAN